MAQMRPLLLPNSWTTSQLIMADSILPDVGNLHAVFTACAYIEPWDNTFRPVPEDEIAQLVTRSLALDEENYRFKLQCIRQQGQAKIIGYYHLYHNAPQPQTVFISMFVLHPNYQGQKMGRVVIAGLAEQLARLGYQAIWLRVYLKNWPALQFWIKTGFTTIIKYEGDKEFSSAGQASLILERRITA